MAGITDDGQELEPDQCRRLFDLPGTVDDASCFVATEGNGHENAQRVTSVLEQQKKNVLADIAERNAEFFDEEMEKLDKWADDIKKSLEIRLKQLDVDIKTLKTESRKMADLQRKVAAHRKVKDMEKKRAELRRNLFEEQDQIDQRKDDLLETIEARMSQSVKEMDVLRIGWEVK